MSKQYRFNFVIHVSLTKSHFEDRSDTRSRNESHIRELLDQAIRPALLDEYGVTLTDLRISNVG